MGLGSGDVGISVMHALRSESWISNGNNYLVVAYDYDRNNLLLCPIKTDWPPNLKRR